MKGVHTRAILAKTGADTNVPHLQAHVLLLLSYECEHASTWFGLVDARMRTRGCSPRPAPAAQVKT
jgi:hypothetical protein